MALVGLQNMVTNPSIDRYSANQWKLALLPNFFVLAAVIGIFGLIIWYFQPLPISNIGSFQALTNNTAVTNSSININNTIINNSKSTPPSTVNTKSNQTDATDIQTSLDLSTVLVSQRVSDSTFYLSKECGNIDSNKICALSVINTSLGTTTQLSSNLFSNPDINQFEGSKFGFAVKQNQDTRINFTSYNNKSSSYQLLTFDTDTRAIILIRSINPGDTDYGDYLI